MSEKICQSCERLLSLKRFKIKPGLEHHKIPARERVCIACSSVVIDHGSVKAETGNGMAKTGNAKKMPKPGKATKKNQDEKLCLYCETTKPISEFRAGNAKVDRSRFCASCNEKRAWLEAGLAHVDHKTGKTNVTTTFEGGKNYAEPGKSHQSEAGRAVCASWGHFK